MKLVMTLLARDEADIVDAQIAFHLHAGVDFVVATDNRSEDGTTEILERYERAGYLHLLREEGEDMRQAEWVTRMARLAATEHGADWVINADADEFWWPRGGSLKELLATVPERYGVIRGCWRHFLPRPDDGSFFAERMTVRLGTPAFPGDKTTIFHAHQKVAHRADPDVTIEGGNHNAIGDGLEPIRAWHPAEVLHFSFRTVSQLERKSRGGWLRNVDYEPMLHRLSLDDASRERRLDDFFESFVVSDEALARGVADGTLAIDTRLRDALRVLRDQARAGFVLPSVDSAPRLSFPRPDVREDAMYAGEASVLVEIDGVVRAERRIETLEERLATLEREPLWRLGVRIADRRING
jgi:glycosyl transferase family 2